MFDKSFIRRAPAWYQDGAIIKPRTVGTDLEYDGNVDIAGQYQGALLNDQMVSKAVFDILGLMTDPRCLYMEMNNPGAGTLYDQSGQGHNGTYHGSMTSADRVYKGMGVALDFDGTDDYVDLGDDDDFSFGDGSNDRAVTLLYVCEILNGADIRVLNSKWDNTTGSELREWFTRINANETISYMQYDESANVYCSRTTNDALSAGWHIIQITSPGDGGATAMNNVKIYVDGVLVGSWTDNNASYVAMENLGTEMWIGARKSTGGVPEQFMNSDIALTGIDGSEWSAYEVWRAHQVFKGLYGL